MSLERVPHPTQPPPRRVPVFVPAQAECEVCGREIVDPLVAETWGRVCSARCHYARGLPSPARRAG